jgi:hypothetical protein
VKTEEKIELLRKALTDLLAHAPSGDELRLLLVGLNGPGMQPGNENGDKLRLQCDELTAARAQAVHALKECDKLKRKAYVPVVEDDGIRLGIAEEGELGYFPQRTPGDIPFGGYLKAGVMDETGRVKTFEVARQIADELNLRLFGINKQDGWLIAAESMRSGMKR